MYISRIRNLVESGPKRKQKNKILKKKEGSCIVTLEIMTADMCLHIQSKNIRKCKGVFRIMLRNPYQNYYVLWANKNCNSLQ